MTITAENLTRALNGTKNEVVAKINEGREAAVKQVGAELFDRCMAAATGAMDAEIESVVNAYKDAGFVAQWAMGGQTFAHLLNVAGTAAMAARNT